MAKNARTRISDTRAKNKIMYKSFLGSKQGWKKKIFFGNK